MSFVSSVFRWRQFVASAWDSFFVVISRRVVFCCTISACFGTLRVRGHGRAACRLFRAAGCFGGVIRTGSRGGLREPKRHTADLCVSLFVISIVSLVFYSKQCVVLAWGRFCCCDLHTRCLLLYSTLLGLPRCTADARTWSCCVQAVPSCWLPKGEAYVRD
jgi:hypothetical protein